MKREVYSGFLIVVMLLVFFSPLMAQKRSQPEVSSGGRQRRQDPAVEQKKSQGSEVNIRGFLYPEELKPEGPKQRPKLGRPTRVASLRPPARPQNAEPPLALGYTIFMKQPSGEIVRVNPKRIFRTGDCFRIMFEPGIDGYLYIIHQEDINEPKLLFPDERIHQSNKVSRGKSVTVPSNNWWCFIESESLRKQRQVVEHVTVILSREELDTNAVTLLGRICFIRRYKHRLNVFTDSREDAGEAITEKEKEALQERNVDLNHSGTPQATVVVANWGLEPLVATEISLVHKARK
jgi:hypothetical protein